MLNASYANSKTSALNGLMGFLVASPAQQRDSVSLVQDILNRFVRGPRQDRAVQARDVDAAYVWGL
jgi:hypothetical protein